MNRLQYRHAFAKRYHERTGNYCVGWALSKSAAKRVRQRQKELCLKFGFTSIDGLIERLSTTLVVPALRMFPIKISVAHTTPFTGILDEQLLRKGLSPRLIDTHYREPAPVRMVTINYKIKF